MQVIRMILGSLYVTVACAGCFPLARLSEMDDIPGGAARVEEMPDAFEQPADHPLLDAPAGTVIDDLGGLGGCWGAYAGPELIGVPSRNSIRTSCEGVASVSSERFRAEAPFPLGSGTPASVRIRASWHAGAHPCRPGGRSNRFWIHTQAARR